MKKLCCGYLTSLALIATAAADVLKVGPGELYPTVQSAVNAASNGDLVLIGGNLSAQTPILIDGKGLTIAGDGTVPAILGTSVAVKNTSAAQPVVLWNLVMEGFEAPGLAISQCDGPVWVARSQANGDSGFAAGFAGALVLQSDTVAFSECSLRGSPGVDVNQWANPNEPYSNGFGGAGLFARSSNVAVFASDLTGANGGTNCSAADSYGFCYCEDGLGGGEGLEVPNGFVFASATAFTGGDGNPGGPLFGCVYRTNGGGGGNGVRLNSAGAAFDTIAPLFTPGTGDWDGQDVNVAGGATYNLLPGPTRTFSTSGVVREGESLTLTYMGEPGDRAAIFLSSSSNYSYGQLGIGANLMGLPILRRLIVGTIPASGVLTVPLPTPALPGGDQNRTWFLQGAFLTTAGSIYLADPQPWMTLAQGL